MEIDTVANHLRDIRHNVGDVVLGYIAEQSYSTFNKLAFRVIDRIIPCEDEVVYLPMTSEEYRILEKENIRAESCGIVGFGIGALQDIAVASMGISYLAGNDSKLAGIAAGITGAKVISNTISFLGTTAYGRIKNQREI